MTDLPKYKIVIFPRRTWRGVRWHFHIKEENGEIVAQSEAYSRRVDCEKTVENLRANLYSAEMTHG